MALTERGEALAYEIAFALSDPADTLDEFERRARDVAPQLRDLACIVLLTRADIARYRENLITAALLWRDYLRAAGSTPAAEAGRSFAASRCRGLFDALAANAWDLALEIAVLMPSEWRRDLEYEDDFAWSRSIALAVSASGVVEAGVAAPLLVRFDASLEGQPSARLDLARVLLARRPEGFNEAFEALLLERRIELQERIVAGELGDTAALCERRLFIEGLAVLACADAAGWATEKEYLYCPSIARRSGT